MRSAIRKGEVGGASEGPLQAFQALVSQISSLQKQATSAYPQSREALKTVAADSGLQDEKIGLIYGGATKIKQYVFEEAQLQDIRGASALLDRINLIDTPALFHGEGSDRFAQCQNAAKYCQQVRRDVGEALCDALIPELIVYSTGGNVLAFCPESQVEAIADAIEKRYTHETLTAQSCVVGDRFSPLEVFFGLLEDPVGNTLWLEQVKANRDNPGVQAYFNLVPNKKRKITDEVVERQFRSRKNFNELVGKLANQFNQRRSGWDDEIGEDDDKRPRPSRLYPPMFETHPYLVRDDGDRRSLVLDMDPERLPEGFDPDAALPDGSKFSEPLARKHWIGQITKRENSRDQAWYREVFNHSWNPLTVLDAKREDQADDDPKKRENLSEVGLSSWVSRFEQFLLKRKKIHTYDSDHVIFDLEQNENHERPRLKSAYTHYTREARSLHEIGAASNGFVAYIYADGNNMGQYIRDEIATPEEYQRFSEDIFEATEQAVYHALAEHIRPYKYTPDARSSRKNREKVWIHPFEIITIGGDDVLLIVQADKGLEVAHTIGVEFEKILHDKERYLVEESSKSANPAAIHRYCPSAEGAELPSCCLSTSSGVLITAIDTPIYYADQLVRQLLKSAKKRAKELKKSGYFGGTVDFLTLKAVTMISSNITSFRDEGLTKRFPNRSSSHFPGEPCELHLKLYAAPYTLHELGGLIATVRSLHESDFPKSQLYQIRSLLEQGKQTAILNYRYFRVRLEKDKQDIVEEKFEQAWCEAETNSGNLAPWMSPTYQKRKQATAQHKIIYSTIWREIVDLLPFIKEQSTEDEDQQRRSPSQQEASR